MMARTKSVFNDDKVLKFRENIPSVVVCPGVSCQAELVAIPTAMRRQNFIDYRITSSNLIA